MKKKRYSEEQIAFALRQHESRTSVAEIDRKMGISEPTFYRWKKQYAGLRLYDASSLERLLGQRPEPQLLFSQQDLLRGRLAP